MAKLIVCTSLGSCMGLEVRLYNGGTVYKMQSRPMKSTFQCHSSILSMYHFIIILSLRHVTSCRFATGIAQSYYLALEVSICSYHTPKGMTQAWAQTPSQHLVSTSCACPPVKPNSYLG
jgi:hypothetical protein